MTLSNNFHLTYLSRLNHIRMSYSYSILTILVSFESSQSTDFKSENHFFKHKLNILNQQKISGKNRTSDGMLSSTNSEVFELPKSVKIFGNFEICSSITKRWLQDLVLQRRLAVLLLIRSIWNSASSFDNVLCYMLCIKIIYVSKTGPIGDNGRRRFYCIWYE